MFKKMFSIALLATSLTGPVAYAADAKPTIVLVHGAFADASSWTGVIGKLESDGYRVVAVANPLRSVKGDSAYLKRIIGSLDTPVVLVGHSYGGAVISEAATKGQKIKSLVYVSAFAPEIGESALELSGKFPGCTLAPTLDKPVELENGAKDLYIQQDKFHKQFAADVSEKAAAAMAASQRPVTDVALGEAATNAGWKEIPSWSIFGSADKNIPPEAMKWMAKRANAKETVEVKGASHVVMVSHPDRVAKVIEDAAASE